MPRKLTAQSLVKYKTGNQTLDILARKVVLAISESKFSMEEQPINDDGLAENYEYFGQWKGLNITAQRSQKHGGIFPRFFLYIDDAGKRYTVKGGLASKAYNSSDLLANKLDEEIDESEIVALVASLDDLED